MTPGLVIADTKFCAKRGDTMSVSVIFYGLVNCDTCRKALKRVQAQGVSARLHDLRRDGVCARRLENWLAELGPEVLLNKRSTTWRTLTAAQKENPDLRALLREHPAVMKRPVVVLSSAQGERVVCAGFGPAEQTALSTQLERAGQ